MSPAAARLRAARICGIESGSTFPFPTATNVPTRLRTIWCRKELAAALISTRPLDELTARRRSSRTVLAWGSGDRQKDAKSCSPSSSLAAARIRERESRPE